MKNYRRYISVIFLLLFTMVAAVRALHAGGHDHEVVSQEQAGQTTKVSQHCSVCDFVFAVADEVPGEVRIGVVAQWTKTIEAYVSPFTEESKQTESKRGPPAA